jgi:hypothetical protein
MALNPALRKMVSSAKNKYKNSGGDTVKPKEGRNTFRIIAPTPEQASWVPASGQFWADLGVHWIKADEAGKPIAVIGDTEIVHQRPSVISTAIGMAIESAMDETTKKLYESWQSRKSILVNAIDRASNEVVVLELTPTTFGKFLELYEIYADAGQDIGDINSGIDVVLTREGKGLNTKYDLQAAPGVSQPVTPDQLAACKNLQEFIESKFFRGEEQKALNAIAQIAGVAVPALPGASGVSTPTAALTSDAASVAPAAPAPAAAAPAVDPEAEARKQAALAAQQAAAAQAAAPAPTPTPAPAAAAPAVDPTPAPAAAPVDTGTGLDKSEEDALLAELDSLTNI